MNKIFHILKKCSGCGHTFTSSYRKSNPCGKCGGKVEIVQDIQALLEAHKEIVGNASGGPINAHTQCQVKWFIPLGPIHKGFIQSEEARTETLMWIKKIFEEARVSIPSDEFTIEDFTIYVWPDYTWISKEDSTEEYFQGKSDDYMILDVPDYVKDVDQWLRAVKPQG